MQWIGIGIGLGMHRHGGSAGRMGRWARPAGCGVGTGFAGAGTVVVSAGPDCDGTAPGGKATTTDCYL